MKRIPSAALRAFLFATVATGAPAAAQTPERAADWRAQVDRVFAEYSTAVSPGCALGVYDAGHIAYERGYGYADLENDVRIGPQTVFYVGSVSKQFTAFAAALAIQQGRVRLDDDIRKYLPELPDYGAAITVRHLIHHTSGVRDVNTLMGIAGRRDTDAYDNEDVLRWVSKQRALNFRPGDEYLYSNSGYALLALIVGRSTGVPFAKFAEDNIFAPLGMSATHFHDDQSRMVKHRADAYARVGGELRLNTPVNERAGAGGVFSNVRDLLHWEENFHSSRVGGADLIRQVQTPGRLNNGAALSYAWGLTVGSYRGQRVVEHGGSLGGYRAYILRFPDRRVSVALLCNLASIVPGALAHQVADVYLASVLSAPAVATGRGGATPAQIADGPAPTRAQLDEYAGTYFSDEVDATYVVFVQDGTIALRRGARAAARLTPAGSDVFRQGSVTYRFVRDADRRVEAIDVDAGRARGVRFVKR